MGTISDKGISEVEEFLKSKFDKNAPTSGVPSIASPATASTRIDQLVLPDEERGRMPFTKDKYVVRENPQLVQWERETRKFLRNLSPAHGHRISAVMIYEWATGIQVKELLEQGGTASPDLRKINECLRHYFGKPYQTYIGGRKVPRAYKVKSGYYIRRHRPMTITLYLEYSEGVLNP
jgi:hypothetical protein